MFSTKELETIKAFIKNSSESSRIYLGADSHRFKKNGVQYARHTVCVVVHKDSSNGAKIFGYNEVEKDLDHDQSRPFQRMITETEKVIELFKALEDTIAGREVEIHLDINSIDSCGSYVAMGSALGYVQGMTGITPKFKPEAFAASHCADRGGDW